MIVHVSAAEAAVSIPIYAELLAAVSPYFRSAFKGSFKESSDKSIVLVDVSEQTFHIFME